MMLGRPLRRSDLLFYKLAAYYNEHDPYAAQWLRNLIAAGHIAPGDMDERDIQDVTPADLDGYTQCHFFAGTGAWSLALRQAGWPDDAAVWTGSCPCQPFSTAGKGAGFGDERHLWPAWFHLISQRQPAVVFGEQVASPDGYAWLDLVQTDMEATGYAVGPVVLPAAGVGAPHGRHRIYFVADAAGPRLLPGALARIHCGQGSAGSWNGEPQRPCSVGSLADAMYPGRAERGAGSGQGQASGVSGVGGVGVANCAGREPGRPAAETAGHWGSPVAASDAGPTNGFWAAADWLPCRDNTYRPVEPGTFPLAHGVAARMGKLRAYGNAIVAPVAEAFIRAYLDVMNIFDLL